MLGRLLGLNRPSNYYPSPERPSFDLNSAAAWDAYEESSVLSISGIRVTHRSALCHPAFWQAVTMLSDDAACLGYSVKQQISDPNDDEDQEDFRRDTRHPADYLLSVQANPDTPAVEFIGELMAHALVYGNGYALVTRNSSNALPKELYNLLPDRTRPFRTREGFLWYATWVDGEEVFFPASEIIHIKGLKFHSNDRGTDPVEYHRDLVGLGQSAFSFASQFYRRGGRTGGILMLPVSMKPADRKLEEEKFRGAYEQPDLHFKTVVTRDGVKFEPAAATPQESQMIEGRAADARDFARLYKIPPQKLGLPDAMGFASLEQSQRQYLQQALWPWAKKLKANLEMRLLTQQQLRQRTHQIAIDTTAIVQLDEKVLNEILAIQRQNAIINANEWRRRIGMNSRSDPAANEFINPNTTADAGRTPPEEGDNPPDEEGDSPENPPEEPRPSGATRGIVLAAVDRCMGRLCLDAQRNAKKPAAFMLWLDTYPDKHRAAFAGLLLPATDLFLEQHKDQLPSEADSAEIACGWLSEIFATVHKALAPLVDPPHAAADLVANVEAASEGLLADCGSLTDSLLEMELSP